ncbi:CusA/CzcA family heavy metal efflux RND transporter [Aureitalea sp. L0-47]|uniref:CusA/CzcA family heavy metal efflux RND transporter n=1 Tax=Aureitalea sp. L0-47 TaxID=2816962 RepID=UPI0022370280|nr:CusA/CzcA family heavy metal efflux RND transporter [Aureitalea sp. L0-47]MCW5518233.1 CusA/CzcA family heavy metal efflux RND transporter [Aureitalea sp. L0-47]
MLSKIIDFSIRNKFLILLFTLLIVGFGLYSLLRIPIGAVPDVTNNQVQVITTSENLGTRDMEQFITYPVELEMANLPGVVEIRSISKFGLSVVTIVFEENMGTYLPRQLIAEKIKSASEKIPEGFGTPEMGPISTGLGEIYQYILDVEPGYEERYSAMDLRTIQDWIVKRQLSGIPGVVEVNSWGGYLKQYEVAIYTEKLNAMNISVKEIMVALENNNNVGGGGYIEKVNQAYFIRGEGLVSSLEDIENIVVKNIDGFPIYIRDVADVGYGSATRYGAITGNGEGEKVLGQVMMLKGGNPNEVINAVHERVASISKTLPEGVYINGFLERSELIGKTTYTVAENLILGSLIVIFVVVLLLGNLRSGLVVASIIPLSLLFALSLMYLFGVDANLMSLGAIDFGIIIDGAVIIIEFTAFQISKKFIDKESLDSQSRQELIDEATKSSASKMMNSAIFGQLIILIVFIPILSLSGVEGKMFGPMALTFSFALIGAMLLCLTYVPVAASLFLKPTIRGKRNISVRIMSFLNRLYDPTIRWALRSKKLVLVSAVLLLGGSVYLFTTMGGEFVPTLDEGDFVIQPVLKTGTSLSKTIEITTKIEQILLDEFPEVDQVVSRIGAAEVPTDPMSMEESDVIIRLKPKSEWVSAATKDELADKFKEALSVLPDIEVEFTQPIEMRFNELITGVRADIAIKIFGEDLDVLNKKGNEIKAAIREVEGAADITVEKVDGLPQMNVKYDRSKIARYGLNVSDLNEMISMGFSGKSLGSVFDGEKRFDLVLRLKEDKRRDIENIENLYVDVPSGGKVPMRELAEIKYTKDAAKISRDDTRRRIVVGINVRNRDLQSVVDDVQEIIESEVTLPVGYSISYGGQFENLQTAKSRLKVAVPISLLLIFLLLYFAFGSIKDALMIFTAIPLSAVGGVLLLWLRDMPFSISAGVGFIALFGIAVLNGIVLIEQFKHLKDSEMKENDEYIVYGAKSRLRAVLLTASAAALGFLPMAVSTSAGAEVQRPLATVVIGGLVTSTLLTLVVLPVLYSIFRKERKLKINRNLVVLCLLLFGSSFTFAQEKEYSISELKQLAFENNQGLKSADHAVNEAKAMIGTAFDFDKTNLYFSYDENNLAFNNEVLEVVGIQQDFLFPTVYYARKRLGKTRAAMVESTYDIRKWQVEKELMSAYNDLLFHKEREDIYTSLDSLYERFAYAAKRKFELGESNYLENVTAKAKHREIAAELLQVKEDIEKDLIVLQAIVQSEESFKVKTEPLSELDVSQMDLENNPFLLYSQNRELNEQAEFKLEKQQLLPDISLEYFTSVNPSFDQPFRGFQAGLKIPILFNGKNARIKASRISKDRSAVDRIQDKIELEARYNVLVTELQKQAGLLQYYKNEGVSLSEEILRAANLGYKNGELDFFQYIQSVENAKDISLSYLKSLYNYNQTVLKINYLTL